MSEKILWSDIAQDVKEAEGLQDSEIVECVAFGYV